MLEQATRPRRRFGRVEELELDDGTIVRYRRHENGGGRVALNATVHATAFIAESAWVDPGAVVQAGARVARFSWIERHASIGPWSVIADSVRVGAGAVIGNGCRIGPHAQVGPKAQVPDGVVIAEDGFVRPGARGHG